MERKADALGRCGVDEDVRAPEAQSLGRLREWVNMAFGQVRDARSLPIVVDEEKVRANACTRWLSFSTVARAACGLADDGQHLIGTTIVNTANERMRSSRCSPRNRNLISSEDVEGKEVYDAAGESIGEIDHLMIDKISGRIA